MHEPLFLPALLMQLSVGGIGERMSTSCPMAVAFSLDMPFLVWSLLVSASASRLHKPHSIPCSRLVIFGDSLRSDKSILDRLVCIATTALRSLAGSRMDFSGIRMVPSGRST